MNEWYKYENLEKFLMLMRDYYTVTNFREWKGRNGILLRHDVDYSVHKAYKMALVEKSCGVRSTFFVMMTSYSYNPFAEVNRKMLREMDLLGFEIGLHFDPAACGEGDHKAAVDVEAKALSLIVGRKVESISLHNLGAYGKILQFQGYIDACSVVPGDCYLSDSCMDLKGRDPKKFAEKAIDSSIQLNFHPCYYRANENLW